MNYQKYMLKIGEFIKSRKKTFWIMMLIYLVAFVSLAYVVERNVLSNLGKLSPYLEEYKLYNNFAYSHTKSYKFENGDWRYQYLSGQKFEDAHLVFQNGNNYYFETNDLSGLEFQVLNPTMLDNPTIYRYLQKATLVNSTEIMETYELSLKDFVRIADNKKVKDEGVIAITIFNIEDKVVQVDVVLTDYAKLKNETFESFVVSIEYNRHGQIVDFRN